jgi:PIN domain nuclease of toxin-antitoxin system
LQNEQDNVHFEIKSILDDYANTLFVSSVVVQEMVLLFRIGKLDTKSPYKTEQSIINAIDNLGIKTVLFNEKHLSEYLQLSISNNHKDMNDHAIISQAISDKIPLISSDREFEHYISQGLKFIFNKR